MTVVHINVGSASRSLRVLSGMRKAHTKWASSVYEQSSLRRPCKSIGQVPPAEYEQAYYRLIEAQAMAA